jgi:hypothetical protein
MGRQTSGMTGEKAAEKKRLTGVFDMVEDTSLEGSA